MNITRADGHLRCDFAYHAAIVERLKRVHGAEFDKAQRCWFVPLAQADRLMDAFPKASFDYGAIAAALDAQELRVQQFHQSLRALGVRLEVAEDSVVGLGENVSPLLQAEIAQRGMALRALVLADRQRVAESTAMALRPPEVNGCLPTVEPSIVEPSIVERSIVRQAGREPVPYGRRWRRKARPAQGELLGR